VQPAPPPISPHRLRLKLPLAVAAFLVPRSSTYWSRRFAMEAIIPNPCYRSALGQGRRRQALVAAIRLGSSTCAKAWVFQRSCWDVCMTRASCALTRTRRLRRSSWAPTRSGVPTALYGDSPLTRLVQDQANKHL
jgi:hypothetical protein